MDALSYQLMDVGTSDYRVDVPEGYLLKEAYIAQAIAAADKVIVLTILKVTEWVL